MSEDTPSKPVMITNSSIVHCTMGILCKMFTTFPMWVLITGHVLFELWENTSMGIKFFQKDNFKSLQPFIESIGLSWKIYLGDSAVNSNSDTLCFIAGVLLAHYGSYQSEYNNYS